MHKLSLPEVEYLAHRLAKRLMDYDEPLPAFSTRYPGKLESCLEQPFQTFGGQELYSTLTAKSAVLFYLVIKNHPFENGNKRMAVATMLIFLFLNDRWLAVNPDVLYSIALKVATSKGTQKDKMIEILDNFFQEFIVRQ